MTLYYEIVGICWLAFFVAWALLAVVFGMGGRRYDSSTARGVRILLFVVAIFVGVGYGLQGLFARLGNLGPGAGAAGPNAAAAGAALCVVGLAFAIWARVTLGRNWGMPMTRHEDPELVTSGPYRYVRHPIYTGLDAMWIGTSLVYAFAVLPCVLVIGYTVFSALREEHHMQKRFPEAYPEYKKRSKMLVPFLV